MFKKLMPQELGFFDLFNRHIALVLEGATCMVRLVEEWPNAEGRVRRIEELEHECDGLTQLTFDLLHRTFITPLDRDEIQGLISCQDNIIDLMQGAAQRLLLFEVKIIPPKLAEMVRVLCRAVEEVQKAVNMVRGFKDVDKLLAIVKGIHGLENEGDGLLRAGLAQMFKDYANDPLTVIKLKEIFERVEESIDICEDAANVVEGIILEHS